MRVFSGAACISRMVSLASLGSSSTKSISIKSMRSNSSRASRPRLPPQFLGRRKIEIERGAFAKFCLGPNSATMLVDDPLNRRQADARPFEFFAPVQALEDAEQLAGVLHVEPHSVVPNED